MLLMLLMQDLSYAQHITRHNGERHVTLEAVDAVIQTTIQAVMLQSIDRRFHRRVLFAQTNKVLSAFALDVLRT